MLDDHREATWRLTLMASIEDRALTEQRRPDFADRGLQCNWRSDIEPRIELTRERSRLIIFAHGGAAHRETRTGRQLRPIGFQRSCERGGKRCSEHNVAQSRCVLPQFFAVPIGKAI